MEEDTEYKKLPIEERCVHKLWKARLNGYEESIKIFREIDDEKSPEWNKFTGLIKKFVVDSHAMCQERGLEATLLYVENSANANRIVGDVVAGIVAKCIAASKTKTRELSVQVILMCIEIEKQEVVVEELVKGMDQKNPKIVAACTATICEALKEFGSKIVALKPIVKKLATLLSDRDKSVRDEGKRLAVEMYRWIGVALKPQIATMPAVILTELESEFEKQKSNKAVPTRYVRSQQAQRKVAVAAVGANCDADAQDDDDVVVEEVDPLAFVEAVEILSKIPKDFYDKLESKKWQERKESLEALETLLKDPKLENGDYGELVRALRKVVAKDTNVMLVAMAGKAMAGLANGLKRHFSPYVNYCIPTIYEKFKEKKTNCVAALREAIDAIYPCTTLEAIFDDSLEALNNKNPNVKAETSLFLARAFSKTQPAHFNKKILKALMAVLIKNLNESDPAVRDASAEVLATIQKLLGEKAVTPYLSEVDPLKLAKIKESAEKVVLNIKAVAADKPKPKLAAAAATVKDVRPSTAPKRVINTATMKRPKAATESSADKGGGNAVKASQQFEREMTPEEVTERATELLSSQLVAQIGDTNWKTRLAAAEIINEMIGTLDVQPGLSQCLIKLICQKPGLKETNLQVLKTKLEIIKAVASRFGISQVTADQVVPEMADRMGDTKSIVEVAQTLTAITGHLGVESTVNKVLGFAMDKKSPKLQSEALTWAGCSVSQFGLQSNTKSASGIAEYIKKGLQSTNTTVRQAALGMFGAMVPYVGANFISYFDSEKTAMKQQLQAEMEKNLDSKPVSPTKQSVDDNYGDDDEPANSADVQTRVDISPNITEALLTELSDKNWKNRNEALLKIQGFLKDAKHIKPTIGDLPQALALRLVDSNAKIAQVSLSICQTLAEAMGTPCKQYLRILFPGILNGLGDNKSFIRTASITCLNVWGEQAGYKEFFDGEIIADSLKAGSSPVLRSEMWAWLTIVLPKVALKAISKDELLATLPHLYSNICDRNADVRKNANDAIYGFMLHLGYDGMVKALEKQKPTSKKEILAALDKTRPNMPIKPLPKQRQQAPIIEDARPVRSASSKSIKANTLGKNVPAASRKKEEEIDTTPLLATNNLKNQRLIDEQKLKVLKWAFTTPREEFTELLRDQMSAASVNKGLMANMFHEDFRYHLKAIESLHEDLPNNSRALISNLDLILKWISLRLYDTNPSVLLKGLEYLNSVFPVLLENEYLLAENEGSCFIPHLLIKFGDPKDTVRGSVRSIFRQMCLVYPFTKVFCYIMDGLKSKNARQRTECLDELGYLIETYSISVCQPSPQLALKEIARHISDRDNSVRNAALNCVVQAYFLVDEKIYKLVGQLNEKDLSMLDERIKRAKKNRVVPVEQPPSKSVTPPRIKMDIVEEEHSSETAVSGEIVADDVSTETSYEEPVDIKPRVEPAIASYHSGVPPPLTASRPFGLDPVVVAEIERDWLRSEDIQLYVPQKFDLSFLHSPLKLYEKDGVTYPADKFNLLVQRGKQIYEQTKSSNFPTNTSPQKLQTTGASLFSPRSPMSVTGSLKTSPKQPQRDPNLVRIIQSISSADTNTAVAALNELSDILENPAKQAVLKDYEEMYVDCICMQFKHLSQIPINKSMQLYQPVLTSTYSFFTSKNLGKNIGIDSLKKLMSVLLSLMTDHKLTSGDDGQYTKVINGICLRILDRTNFTNLNCALIRLLRETCLTAGLPKFTDLLMKCIWRNVKINHLMPPGYDRETFRFHVGCSTTKLLQHIQSLSDHNPAAPDDVSELAFSVMPEKSCELEYEVVLLEINEFMLALPSAWWTHRPSDTPLRTVKTIIHNMAKIKGPSILEHLKEIPAQSELHSYLLKVLKNVQKDNPTAGQTNENRTAHHGDQLQLGGGGGSVQNYKFTKHTHETITQIFKLISEKETNREGIKKLFEFKKQNPMVDITPFIKGANPVFKKYIEEQLDEIEQSNRRTNNADMGTYKMTASIHVPTDKCDSDYWMQKLGFLLKKKDAD